MGVYLVNKQLNSLVSLFHPAMIKGRIVTTGDGMIYYIQENSLEFIEANYDFLNENRFRELTMMIRECYWLQDKEALIQDLSELKELKKWQLAKELGDRYFENQEFSKSLDHYITFISSYDSLNHELKGDMDFLDHVYCQIGIILMTIGEINEGIELMDYAYGLYQSHKILLQLTKYKIEFNIIQDLSLVEELVTDISSHATEDANLSFLVWYYNYIGDLESSITSYMQIQNIELRFKLVDYYMVYMLESKQLIAMESFLKPLKELDESRYLIELIYVYIKLEQYEEALSIITDASFPIEKKNLVYIQKSICNLGLKRIIESITSINKVNAETLNEQERESYYVQLAQLSKYSKDFSKEQFYNRQLLSFWQKKYRQIYSGILHNTKWKVNK